MSIMAASRSNEASKRNISETQRLYGDLLGRPLDENQLARPSFKLIQGIVKSLITETRTLRNVFNSSEFETENKTLDKRKRTDFVQKLIDFAANHKQPVVGCVAAKIIAGLEPNKTNELLQSLAKIALTKVKDREPNRPRTFTKQSHGSGLPLKPSSIVTGQAVKASARRQPATQQQRVAHSVARDRRPSSRQRDIEEAAARRVSDDSSSGLRNISGSSSRNASPSTVKRAAPSAAISATLVSKQIGDSRVTCQQEANDERLELAKTHTADLTSTNSGETKKLSSASKSTSQQFSVLSESDIGKNLPQLRANLRILALALMEINRLAVVLKDRLADGVDKI